MDVSGAGSYFGYEGGPDPDRQDPPGWIDGAPTDGRDQSCAFCNSPVVAWVHPLARELVHYRIYGKRHTLPTFWMLCDGCEEIYKSGDDEAAVRLMKLSDGWLWESDEDVAETIRQPLIVFRRADKGSRRLVG
jgi:hypothetical protein